MHTKRRRNKTVFAAAVALTQPAGKASSQRANECVCTQTNKQTYKCVLSRAHARAFSCGPTVCCMFSTHEVKNNVNEGNTCRHVV